MKSGKIFGRAGAELCGSTEKGEKEGPPFLVGEWPSHLPIASFDHKMVIFMVISHFWTFCQFICLKGRKKPFNYVLIKFLIRAMVCLQPPYFYAAFASFDWGNFIQSTSKHAAKWRRLFGPIIVYGRAKKREKSHRDTRLNHVILFWVPGGTQL